MSSQPVSQVKKILQIFLESSLAAPHLIHHRAPWFYFRNMCLLCSLLFTCTTAYASHHNSAALFGLSCISTIQLPHNIWREFCENINQITPCPPLLPLCHLAHMNLLDPRVYHFILSHYAPATLAFLVIFLLTILPDSLSTSWFFCLWCFSP